MKQIYLLVLLVLYCDGKRFRRCELVQELRLQGFPEEKMRDWVCLIENESSRRTDVIGGVNRNRSRDYGLFQINSNLWCSDTDVPGKGCDVRCADVLTDDITAACDCAKTIFRRQGFSAWVGWLNRCQGDLPDISMC